MNCRLNFSRNDIFDSLIDQSFRLYGTADALQSVTFTVQHHPQQILYPYRRCELLNGISVCCSLLQRGKGFRTTQLWLLWVLSLPVFWWHLIYTNPSWLECWFKLKGGGCAYICMNTIFLRSLCYRCIYPAATILFMPNMYCFCFSVVYCSYKALWATLLLHNYKYNRSLHAHSPTTTPVAVVTSKTTVSTLSLPLSDLALLLWCVFIRWWCLCHSAISLSMIHFEIFS